MIERLPAPIPDNEEAQTSGILQTVWRRRWFFLVPFFTLGLLGYAVAHILPLQYRSSALIIVEQRKIPNEYVLPNVLMTLQKRLDAMTQQILSRTRLQHFIEDFGLYTSERKRKSMDDVIDTMQKRISVELVEPGQTGSKHSPASQTSSKNELTGFEINFSDPNPYTAQRVTNELTSLFIEEDSRERTTQSQETTAFLESQLQEGRKQLAAEEEKMRQYKLAHLGELPAEQQIHLSVLAGLEAQLQASTSALDRAEQQRIYLESMRAQQQMFNSLVTPPSTAASSALANGATAPEQPGAARSAGTSLEATRATLADLQQQLRDLTVKFTDKHPEIERLKREIADTEATVDRLAKERTAGLEMDSRLKAVLAEIESERRKNADLLRRIGELQANLSQSPIREQEMAELTRSYENAKAYVQSLLQKKEGSELASNLEEQQGGERFRLLDPGTLPKKPEGRLKIVLAGWAFAFAAGAGLVLLREKLDKSIHQTNDLEAFRQVPVLIRIPEFRSPLEERRGRRRRWLELAAVTMLVVIALASGADTLLRG